MDTDVSHEVERRLSRLEEKVGISDDEEGNGDNGEDEEEEVQSTQSDEADGDTYV